MSNATFLYQTSLKRGGDDFYLDEKGFTWAVNRQTKNVRFIPSK